MAHKSNDECRDEEKGDEDVIQKEPRGESHVKRGAKIGIFQLQTKEQVTT